MGKKTLYHPVSLHVIRGAFEYCEIKIGRLTQTWNDPTCGTANYTAVITYVPDHMVDLPLWKLAKVMRNCFAQDVSVYSVSDTWNVKTGKRTLVASLLVDIHEITPMEHMLEEKAK